MQLKDLVTDKTFFIMQDGEVYTYFRTGMRNNRIVYIFVYDRTSSTGISILDWRNVKSILTEGTEEYDNKLKEFMKFLYNDLKDNKMLYRYICHIWNGNSDAAFDLYNEDCSLSEQYIKYMQELINRNAFDSDIVNYFYKVYCEQEITYPKYSEEWLVSNYQYCAQ